MRMDLIQPFINAADAVFAESLQGPTKIGDLLMEEGAYHRKGVAALIVIKGISRVASFSISLRKSRSRLLQFLPVQR